MTGIVGSSDAIISALLRMSFSVANPKSAQPRRDSEVPAPVLTKGVRLEFPEPLRIDDAVHPLQQSHIAGDFAWSGDSCTFKQGLCIKQEAS